MKKRLGLVILGLVFLSYSVIGAELNLFIPEMMDISPPTPPEADIDKDRINILLSLKDYNTKKDIRDIHVNIEFFNLETDEFTRTIQYVNENGLLELKLNKGNWKINLKIDELTTNGKDYFFSKEYELIENFTETIHVLPVGSIQGTIYNQAGDVVPNAKIKFDCGTGYGEVGGVISDNYGSFFNYWLPVGSCRILAKDNLNIGYKEVDITKGNINSVDIILDKTVRSSNILFIGFVILIMILLIGLYTFFSKQNKKIEEELKELHLEEEKLEEEKKELNKEKKEIKEKKEVKIEKEIKQEKVETKKEELNPRARDIIATLKDREKQVVEYLMKNENKSSQGNIKNATRIPKTSLVRVFESLEGKKVVLVEKLGKMKKVELTDWFLGKE